MKVIGVRFGGRSRFYYFICYSNRYIGEGDRYAILGGGGIIGIYSVVVGGVGIWEEGFFIVIGLIIMVVV